MRYISSSPKETKMIAGFFARKIALSASKPKKSAQVIGLIGDLGSGKTSFVQAFLKTLGAKGKISSPTFVFIKRHPLYKGVFRQGFHIDAYRADNPRDIASLGFKEIIQDPSHIVLVEWADKIKRIMPKNTMWMRFEHLKGNKRRIVAGRIKN